MHALGPPNYFGYDHISIKVNEGDVFDVLVEIKAVNDPPVVVINGTLLGLLYDNATMWEVGVIEEKEDVPTMIGEVIFIEGLNFMHVVC